MYIYVLSKCTYMCGFKNHSFFLSGFSFIINTNNSWHYMEREGSFIYPHYHSFTIRQWHTSYTCCQRLAQEGKSFIDKKISLKRNMFPYWPCVLSSNKAYKNVQCPPRKPKINLNNTFFDSAMHSFQIKYIKFLSLLFWTFWRGCIFSFQNINSRKYNQHFSVCIRAECWDYVSATHLFIKHGCVPNTHIEFKWMPDVMNYSRGLRVLVHMWGQHEDKT